MYDCIIIPFTTHAGIWLGFGYFNVKLYQITNQPYNRVFDLLFKGEWNCYCRIFLVLCLNRVSWLDVTSL